MKRDAICLDLAVLDACCHCFYSRNTAWAMTISDIACPPTEYLWDRAVEGAAVSSPVANHLDNKESDALVPFWQAAAMIWNPLLQSRHR